MIIDTSKYYIVDYSPKAFAIAADFDTALQLEFKLIGGRFNPRLAFGAGWIFSKQKHADQIDAVFAAYGVDNVERCNLSDITPNAAKSASKRQKRGANKALPDGEMNDDERKAFLREAYGDDEYYIKEWPTCVRLASGDVVGIQSPKLTTEFWFGYSDCGQGPTHEEARDACDAANTEEYFIQENTEKLRDILAGLKRERDDTTYKYLFLYRDNTSTRHNERPGLWVLRWDNLNPDSVNWDELLDPYDRKQYEKGYIKTLTDDDRKRLIAAYELELDARTRRCRAYLKRYGTSKLRISTYWMDR